MGGIRIEGSSGNVADATSAGNLKVQLPTTISQMGGVRMFSENDDGAITGVPNVKGPETTSDYRLRVGIDQVLDHQTWREVQTATGGQKFSAFRQASMQIAAGYSSGYLSIGSGGGALSANQWAGVTTKRSFPAVGISSSIVCEQTFLIPNTIVGSTAIEFGFGSRVNNQSLAGIFFRITTTGIVGVVKTDNGETVTANMMTVTTNVWYNCSIVVSDREVQFWINDIAYAVPITGKDFTIGVTSNGIAMRYFVWIAWSTTPSAQQNVYFGGYTIYYGDVHPVIDSKTNAMLNGASLQVQNTFNTTTSLCNYSAGTQPAAVTLTANTGPGTNYLGGLFTLPSTITPGLSDYPLFSYVVPSPGTTNVSKSHEKSLLVTGIRISELYVATALTGGPLVMQWGISFGGDNSASIAGMNTLNNWENQPNGVGFPLGFQSLAAGAAVGTLTSAIDVSFADAPLVTHPGDRFKVILRVPSGTAITAGEIRGAVLIRGYWV